MNLRTPALHSGNHFESTFARVLPGPCLFLLTLCDIAVGVLAGHLATLTAVPLRPIERSAQDCVNQQRQRHRVHACPPYGDSQSKKCLTPLSRFLLRRLCAAQS